MRLISLNTWGGKIYEPLVHFIKIHSADTDIFCLQEVFNTTTDLTWQAGFRLNLYEEISKILSNHQGYFDPCLNNYIAGSFRPDFEDFNLSWGLAIFIKKRVTVSNHHNLFIYGTKDSFNPKDLNTLPRNIQYINFVTNNTKFTVCNVHGIWVKEGKEDTVSRIKQSEQIKQLLNNQMGKKILCGDFNLGINTKSIRLLEEDFINLIKKYHISTTRNKYYPGEDKFADYTFVSPDIKIKSFETPDLDVSDHLPMILEFS